nr:nickel transport complex protein, NikM subunit, transmembrane [Pedobacter panaciterrae]
MKKITFLALTLLLSFVTTSIFAHALWIETSVSGKIGQKQSVKVFYGEYVANERDNVDKWYSDVKEFSLWLIGPDQKKTQLTLTPGENHFEGTFTPDQNGAYTVVVSHEAKELGGTTKYHFLSSADVIVGKALPAAVQNPNALKLHVDGALAAKVNKPLQLKAFLNDAAVKGKTVSVFSPNGWAKELTTDDNGAAEFTPLWKGRYVVEVSDMDKTPGEHHGNEYKATWKGATYSFEIN